LFVIKVLTYDPLRLKILRSIFAKRAPVQGFQTVGEGGDASRTMRFPQKRTRSDTPFEPTF